MTHFEFGDILLLNSFPYSNLGGMKKRPALVLADTGDQDLLVCRVTSERARNVYDLELSRWKECGLLVPSCLRVSKIAALSKGLILKKLGRLGSPDRKKVSALLKKLFQI